MSSRDETSGEHRLLEVRTWLIRGEVERRTGSGDGGGAGVSRRHTWHRVLIVWGFQGYGFRFSRGVHAGAVHAGADAYGCRAYGCACRSSLLISMQFHAVSGGFHAVFRTGAMRFPCRCHAGADAGMRRACRCRAQAPLRSAK
jgi:hypothetical protein